MARIFLFSLCIYLSFLQSTHAETYKMKLGVENIYYYPYSYVDSKGEYFGFFREIIDKFKEKYNLTLHYYPCSIPDLNRKYRSHDVDFRLPDNPSWFYQRKSTLIHRYSLPIISYTDGVIVRKENLGDISKLKTLGAIGGFSLFEYEDLIESGKIKLVSYDNPVEILSHVNDRKIDGAYLNIKVAAHIIKSKLNASESLFFDERLPKTQTSFFLSTNKYPDVILKFNEFLTKEKKYIDAVKLKYLLE